MEKQRKIMEYTSTIFRGNSGCVSHPRQRSGTAEGEPNPALEQQVVRGAHHTVRFGRASGMLEANLGFNLIYTLCVEECSCCLSVFWMEREKAAPRMAAGVGRRAPLHLKRTMKFLEHQSKMHHEKLSKSH